MALPSEAFVQLNGWMTITWQFTSTAFLGLNTPVLSIEATFVLSQIQLVGRSESKAIRERVRAALLNSGFTVPDRRITINLSPADLPTDHPGYDLPIALALLAASNQLPDSIDQTVNQPICALEELIGWPSDPRIGSHSQVLS